MYQGITPKEALTGQTVTVNRHLWRGAVKIWTNVTVDGTLAFWHSGQAASNTNTSCLTRPWRVKLQQTDKLKPHGQPTSSKDTGVFISTAAATWTNNADNEFKLLPFSLMLPLLRLHALAGWEWLRRSVLPDVVLAQMVFRVALFSPSVLGQWVGRQDWLLHAKNSPWIKHEEYVIRNSSWWSFSARRAYLSCIQRVNEPKEKHTKPTTLRTNPKTATFAPPWGPNGFGWNSDSGTKVEGCAELLFSALGVHRATVCSLYAVSGVGTRMDCWTR